MERRDSQMPAETAVHKPATLQYCILAVLFLITVAYQVLSQFEFVRIFQ